MKGYEKKVSFSTRPFKSSASSKGSDENDRSDQEMSLDWGNCKKDDVKNFMSPAVSAASKATFHRKKILAERNEYSGPNFPNTHLSKTPILDSEASTKATLKASRMNSPNLDAKVSPQKTPLSYNSRDKTPSPKPYDPLTNYLSPRPQFLRYNPARRNQIFLRLQTTDKEVDDTLSVNSASSFDSNNDTAAEETSSFCCEDCCEGEEFSEDIGSLLEQEDEVFDIESDEEPKEEVRPSMRAGLKYLLLLVVLVLATAYICSMNCPTPTQEFQSLMLGYQKIQSYSNETLECVDVGCKFLDAKPDQLGLLGLNRCILDESIEEEMAENIIKKETLGLELEDRIHVESPNIVEEVKKDGNVEVYEEKSVKTVNTSDQFAEENRESGDIIIDELLERKEASVHLVKYNKLLETFETGVQIEDVAKVEVVKETGESKVVAEEELVETKVTDPMVRNIELLGEGYAGMIVTKEAVQACLLSDGSDYQETASHTTDFSEKERVVTNEDGEEIQNEPTHENTVQGKISQGGDKSGSLNVEEVNPLKGLNQHSGTNVLVKVLFGVSACGTFLAAFVLGYNFRGKGVVFASKYLSLVDKHSTKAVVKEKPSLVLPPEREQHQKHLNILMNTMPLINSTDKDIEESYQRRAPSVELLGELEVGATSRSCGFKIGTSSEVNSYSDFLEKDLGSKAYSAPAQVQKNFSSSNTVNPNSSEKLTPKKKFLREVPAKNDTAVLDGEGRNEVITPLRRSARIRNRAVTSP